MAFSPVAGTTGPTLYLSRGSGRSLSRAKAPGEGVRFKRERKSPSPARFARDLSPSGRGAVLRRPDFLRCVQRHARLTSCGILDPPRLILSTFSMPDVTLSHTVYCLLRKDASSKQMKNWLSPGGTRRARHRRGAAHMRLVVELGLQLLARAAGAGAVRTAAKSPTPVAVTLPLRHPMFRCRSCRCFRTGDAPDVDGRLAFEDQIDRCGRVRRRRREEPIEQVGDP